MASFYKVCGLGISFATFICISHCSFVNLITRLTQRRKVKENNGFKVNLNNKNKITCNCR